MTAAIPWLFWVPTVVEARVWYVNNFAGGAANGTTWGDAFVDLQDALAVALTGDELWVAKGRYTPDRGTADRWMSFRVPDGVGLYGGFAGWEFDRAQRDPIQNETILSGDLAGDDHPIDRRAISNCLREHDGLGCDDPVCESIVCSGGLTRCCQAPPTLPDSYWDWECVNAASVDCCAMGGWNVCENTYRVVDLVNAPSGIVLDGMVVEGSYGANAVSGGPGIRTAGLVASYVNLQIVDCIFRWNTTAGIVLEAGNTAIVRGMQATDNTFHGIDGYDSELVVSDSVYFRNGGYGIGNYNDLSSTARTSVSRCRFEGPWQETGVILRGDASITDCVFRGHSWYSAALALGLAVVENCAFLGNDYSAVEVVYGGAILRNCRFIGNRGAHGVGIVAEGSVRAENCLFSGNVNTGGVASVILQDAGSLEVRNCTFSANTTEDVSYPPDRFVGITLWGYETRGIVRNSVIWGNSSEALVDETALLDVASGASLNISRSIVQGWTGHFGGVGNSGVDPLFVDPDGADGILGTEDDDLRLSPDSPAINAGDPNAGSYLPDFDLDDHSRILCGNVDIGAYEFGIGDFDCNRTVNLADFAWFPYCLTGPPGPQSGPYGANCNPFDFNADLAIDLRDLAGFERTLTGP